MSSMDIGPDDAGRLYKHALLRDPDEEGKAYWAAEIAQKGFSQVAWDIIESEEAQDSGYAVISAFEIAFGRVPDEEGLRYWQQQVDDNNDVDFFLDLLVASDEFSTHYGSASREA